MHFVTLHLQRALSQARADWLSGDPSAWRRYTNCLAGLERHQGHRACDACRPLGRRLSRPGMRAPRGLA